MSNIRIGVSRVMRASVQHAEQSAVAVPDRSAGPGEPMRTGLFVAPVRRHAYLPYSTEDDG